MTSMLANIDVDSGSTESGPLLIWRGENDTDGQPIFAESSYDAYQCVPRGEYTLRVTGVRKEREEPNKFAGQEQPNGKPAPATRTLTAVEFEVIAGPHAGSRFLIDFINLKLSSGGGKFSPSSLYRIWSAACPNGGKGIGAMIGGTLTAYVTVKLGEDGTPRYNKMTFDTCAPVDAGTGEVVDTTGTVQGQPAAVNDGQQGQVPAQFMRAG